MGYSIHENVVRVDIFKEGGKWYTTEAVPWLGWDQPIIQDAFLNSLRNHLTVTADDGTKHMRYAGMWAVCLEPYHKMAFPLMMRVPEK